MAVAMSCEKPSYLPRPVPRSRRAPLNLAVWGLIALIPVAGAQEPETDAELSRHVTTVRSQIEDPALDPARREELVLELSGTLDRAAQAAPDAELRRRRWAQAIDLLDRFSRENP